MGALRSPAGCIFSPAITKSLYVATTFGLLVSHDDGCSFRWICEQNVGYGGTFDPKYRIATDGTIFATTYTGLRVSRDGGCTFTTATAGQPANDPGRIADTWIDAIDIGPAGDVWVATADSTKPNNIYRSTDNGQTFEPRGMLSQTIWWKSLALAPSRAARDDPTAPRRHDRASRDRPGRDARGWFVPVQWWMLRCGRRVARPARPARAVRPRVRRGPYGGGAASSASSASRQLG